MQQLNIKNSYQESIKRARKHEQLFYYTDIETLRYIVKNKSLQLTRLDNVNDKYENLRISKDLWNKKIFVACFTHKQCESFFFWNIYAAKQTKEKGVCISFPPTIFENITMFSDSECSKVEFHKIEKSDPSYKKYDCAEDWGYYDISTCDIKYDNYTNIDKNYNDDTKYPVCQGFVKSKEWEDEKETRIRVAFKPVAFENVLNRKTNKFEVPYPPFDRVFIKLSDGVMDNIEIILNPWCCACFEKQVSSILDNKNIKIKQSTMKEHL